ncbi:MAG: FtsQ-type POTRA domain-containing protein [Myxococcota bacterium]|nr:FtsQ-type POTRA domain-containing protein [Myxococcota bacterium]
MRLRRHRRRVGPPLRPARLLAGLQRPLRRIGRGLRLLLPPLLACALLAGVIWSLYQYWDTTPYFRLRSLEITGEQRIGEEEVRSWAGLDEHTHVMKLDPREVERRLEAHPRVADARVAVELPGRVTIHIVERKPAALVLLDGLQLADEHGVVFAPSAGRGEERLPVITGLGAERSLEAVRRGALIREALSVIREWNRLQLTQIDRLSEIHVDPVLGMILYTENMATEVHLGVTEHSYRLNRLRDVLVTLRQEGRRPSYVLLDGESDPYRVTVGMEETSIPSKKGSNG